MSKDIDEANSVDMYDETVDTDFDEVGYEPEVIDDEEDEELSEILGL